MFPYNRLELVKHMKHKMLGFVKDPHNQVITYLMEISNPVAHVVFYNTMIFLL